MKNYLSIAIVCCIMCSQQIFAQTTFLEKIDGLCGNSENSYSGIQTKDGGYIAAGITSCQGQGSYDVSVIKMDKIGAVEWTKTLGGGSGDYGTKIVQSSDTTYTVAGYVNGFGLGSNDMFLSTLSDKGDTLWTRMYGFGSQDYAQNMIQTADKGFALIGSMRDTVSGDDNISFVRTDVEGNIIWAKSYGGSSSDYAYSVCELSDGSFVIVGHSSSFGISLDIVVIKTNSSGDVLWAKAVGDDDSDYGYDVKATSDGGVVIAGKSRKPYTSGNSTYNTDNAYLIKLDKNGDEEWSKLYGENLTNDIAYKVVVMSDGYLLSGETNSYGTGQYDLMMIKTDNTGIVQWSNRYGFDTSFDYGGYASLANDGGIILTGQAQKVFAGKDYDWLIIKTDNLGNVPCQSNSILPTEAAASISLTNIGITDSLLSIKTFSGVSIDSYSSYTDSMYCLNISQLSAYYTYSGSACAGGTVSFTDQSYNASTWAWNFGDPNSSSNTSSAQNPSHVFSANGNYNVSLIVTDGLTNADTITIVVNVSISSNPVDLGKDTTKCGDFEMTLHAGPNYIFYSWSTGSKDSLTFVSDSGTYWVNVTDVNGCTSSDTIIISQCIHTDIQDLDDAITVNLYPNPAKNILNIQSSAKLNKLEIIDVCGKKVSEFTKVDLANKSILLDNVSNGIYLVKIYSGKQILNKQLVKEK